MRKLLARRAWLTKDQTLTLVGLACFLAGALLGSGVLLAVQATQPRVKASALRESDIATAHATYTFIDPLLGIKGGDNSAKYRTMENEVAAYIAGEQKNGLITASVNFRDINESGGFAINPSELSN
jgi:hypothetical protein